MGNMRSILPLVLLTLLTAATPLYPATFLIKADGTGDFPTIQIAIDASVDGDTILLADGIFTGFSNWNLDFGGRSIVVKSETGRPNYCTIHCQNGDAGYHRGFRFHSGENNSAVVDGITIQGGFIREGSGSGILIENGSAPVIKNCIIRDCAFAGNGTIGAGHTLGAGIAIRDSSPLIINNLLMQNNVTPRWATEHIAGGGIYVLSGSPIISGNHILRNNSDGVGGGICAEYSAPEITCNTIEGNDARSDGGGIFILGNFFEEETKIHNNLIINNISSFGAGISWSEASPSISSNTIVGNDWAGLSGGAGTVTNCILYNNVRGASWHSANISYSWVEGGYPGTGNINGTSITFEAGPAGRYYLPDAHECIDAGNDLASNLCLSYGSKTLCMDRLTMRTDQRYDTGLVDIGYHFTRVPATYEVPDDFEMIQEAIDFAINGDVIIVGPGFYNENIDFLGKRIRVEGTSDYLTTTIMGDRTGPVVTFDSGETSNSILSRFIITGGSADYGGGIYIRDSSPRIEFCEVEDNYADLGGGIYCYNSAAVFMTVTITGNEAKLGGGMYITRSGTKINNCMIAYNVANGNESGIMGGGIYIDASIPAITYTVIAGNHAHINYGESRGGGVYWNGAALDPSISYCTFYSNMADVGSALETVDCSPTIANTIIAYNKVGESIRCSGTGGVSLTSCDVYHNDGGDWIGCLAEQDTINGNMSEDPIFCYAAAYNLHISSISPCAAENNPGSVLIGALAVQCYPATYEVHADGSGPYSSIQDAVDHALGGQTIELGDGTYTGAGNRDIDFRSKSITVRSMSGDPDSVIIDCGGSDVDEHQGFIFTSHEGSGARIEGITVANGYTSGSGGGIRLTRSSPTISNCAFIDCYAYRGGGVSAWRSYATITDCRFIDNTAGDRGGGISNDASRTRIENCAFFTNHAQGWGGGMYNDESAPDIIECTFARNSAERWGGGMFNNYPASSPVIRNCTFSQNAALYGAGIYSRVGANPDIYNSIIAFSTEGGAVHCESDATTSLRCCDIFGNAGGDYVGCIAGREGANGNFSRDPLFCDTLEMNYHLHENSPCAEDYSGGCGLVGAHGTACEAIIPPPPTAHRLYQSYPNPFNAAATIAFDISEPADVRVRIYNVTGRLVHVLVEKKYEPGRYEEMWDGRDCSGNEVASGVYFYRLTAGSFTETRKMVLLR